MNNIKLMVAGTKQTTYLGRPAWIVPNGKCTENFLFACKCWKYFLSGSANWLVDAMFERR